MSLNLFGKGKDHSALEAQVSDLTAQLSAAIGQRDEAARQHAATAAERDKAVADLAAAQSALTACQGEKAAAEKDRDDWKAKAETSRADIEKQVKNNQLADLAASQGIPQAAIPPTAKEASADSTSSRLSGAKDEFAYSRELYKDFAKPKD